MTAWDVVRKQVSEEERHEVKKMWGQSSPDEVDLQCSFALCGVRRVYLPVWVFTYDFFGQEFHVFVRSVVICKFNRFWISFFF